MYVTSMVGLWPCIFDDIPHLKRIYRAYSIFILVLSACFTCSAWFKLFILITDEAFSLDEVVECICVASLMLMVIVRACQLRSNSVEKIVKRILTIEKEEYESGDAGFITIYNSYARQSQLSNKIYMVPAFLTIIFIMIRPLLLEDIVKHYPSTNLTVHERPLPLKLWLPFEERNNYLLTYVLHVTCGTLAGVFAMVVDSFNYSLVIFPVGQIQILKNAFQNFDKYVSLMQNIKTCSRGEASFLMLRELILKHKDIISFVGEMNDSMRNVMVSDVLQSSVQLAACMLQLLMTEPRFQNMIMPILFVTSMLIRLLIYYWYANEITVQCSEIGLSVYDNDWYHQPEVVKKMMLMVMLRCEKKIGLEIGPFSLMALSTLIGILKGAYSYMTVVYK